MFPQLPHAGLRFCGKSRTSGSRMSLMASEAVGEAWPSLETEDLDEIGEPGGGASQEATAPGAHRSPPSRAPAVTAFLQAKVKSCSAELWGRGPRGTASPVLAPLRCSEAPEGRGSCVGALVWGLQALPTPCTHFPQPQSGTPSLTARAGLPPTGLPLAVGRGPGSPCRASSPPRCFLEAGVLGPHVVSGCGARLVPDDVS